MSGVQRTKNVSVAGEVLCFCLEISKIMDLEKTLLFLRYMPEIQQEATCDIFRRQHVSDIGLEGRRKLA